MEAWVLKTALNLPGYQAFCGHQRNIKRRIRDWVKSNRKNNKYFPIGSKTGKKVRKAPTNEERAVGSIQRIQAAIATIQSEQGALPIGVKNLVKLICEQAGCSPNTLYKHKELWYPDFDVKGCVTPHSERILIGSEATKNDSEISQAEPQNMAGCVTLEPAYISAITIDSLKDLDFIET